MDFPEFRLYIWNVRNFNFALLRRTGNKYCFVAIYQFPLCVTFVYTFYRFYLSALVHLLCGLFQFSYIFICLKCVYSHTWNKYHVITNILWYGTVMCYCITICPFITVGRHYDFVGIGVESCEGCVQCGCVRASGRGRGLSTFIPVRSLRGTPLGSPGHTGRRDGGSSVLLFLYIINFVYKVLVQL